MIRSAARAILSVLRSLASEPAAVAKGEAARVDFGAFESKVAHYRSLGVRIGEKVRLLGDLDGVNPHLVEIGDYSVIGKGSILLAHCPINGALPASIGRFVYIGFGAIILPGVKLGDFCVVGAGAVVTKSAPPGSVLVGNPARFLRSLTELERMHIEETLRGDRVFGWDDNRSEIKQS